MRALLILLPLLAGFSAAQADIRDLRYRPDNQGGQVWIAFDQQPSSTWHEMIDGHVHLHVGGVDPVGHTILPPSNALIDAIHVTPADDGIDMVFQGLEAWQASSIEIRRNGILLMVSREVEGLSAAGLVTATYSPETADAYTATGHGAVSASGSALSAGAYTAETHNAVSAADQFDAEAEAATHAQAPVDSCAAEAEGVNDNPWDNTHLTAYATCLSDNGELEDAAGLYLQILAFEPENFDAAMSLATIRMAQGDESAASEYINQAASHAVSDAQAARAWARARELRGQ